MRKNSKEYLKIFLNKQYLFKLLIKQRKFFAYSVSVLFLLNCIYAFLKKPVWQAQFQIVLDNTDSKTGVLTELSGISPDIAAQLNIGKNVDSLRTEVVILGSPSVLLPVFDFVKKERDLKGINTQNLRFRKWKKNNLSIYLEPKTSILNIDYRDEDKDLVLPVTALISESYQQYSNKDRKNGLLKNIEYINNQIKKYDKLSRNALRNIKIFSIENDLPPLINSFLDSENGQELDLSVIRAVSVNQIKLIDSQLNQINNVDQDIYLLKYINSVLPEFINKNYAIQLDNVEKRLINLRSKFVEDDISIVKAKKDKRILIDIIKKESIGYLKGKKANALATVKSTDRSKGVLIKYQEMLREYKKYEKILINLEKQGQLTQLENAKALEPWELITNPTILDQPIGPSKKRIIALGFIGSLLASTLLVVLIEKISEDISNYNE